MSTRKMCKDFRKHYMLLVLIIGTGIFLRFYKLDQRWLWQDEAETAVLAQAVLKTGLPNAYLEDREILLYTGRLIPLELPKTSLDSDKIDTRVYAYAQADFDAQGNLRYHPFGDVYLTAVSFWLFGANTFTARMPFALLGVLSIFVIYHLGVFLYCHHVGLVAAFLQAINLNLIFYERMARHPALGNFCFLMTLLFFLKALQENKIQHWIIANIFFVLVFYTNPLFGALATIILIVQSLLVYKNFFQLFRNKNLIVSVVVCSLLILPYILILKPWTVTNMFVSPDKVFFLDRAKYILYFITELMSSVSFLLVILGVIILFLRKNMPDLTLINILGTFTFCILFLLPTTAGPFNTSLPLIAIFILIAGRFIIELYNYLYSKIDQRRTYLTILIVPVLVVLIFFPKITRLPLKLDRDFIDYKINKIQYLSFRKQLTIAKRNSAFSYLMCLKDETTFSPKYDQWNPMWIPEVLQLLEQKKVAPDEWVFTTYQNPTFLFYSNFKVQSIWPINKNFLDNFNKRFWIIIGPNDHIRSPSKWYYGYVGWEDKDRNRNYREVVRNAVMHRMKSGAIIYECNPKN